MSITSRLQALTGGLDKSVEVTGGLFRIHYGLRTPPSGRGLGLDGVEGEELIRYYAGALHTAHRWFQGWPEPHRGPDGFVPVYVFRTERLGFGDCPLTFTGDSRPGVQESQITLRSTFDEPQPELRGERAEVEAAHEAAHAFTHRLVPPLAAVGDLWAWFDEATAVFVEGEVFPGHREALRFSLYWDLCPELALTTWGGIGGYFAAWFVRFLVRRFGSDLLRRVWDGSEGKFGPLEVLDRLLVSRQTSLADVFWDYCCSGYAPDEVAPGAEASFGPRSLTETFLAPSGAGGKDFLAPLACRYYRITWEKDVESTPVHIQAEGTGTDDLRALLLDVGRDGRIGKPTALQPDPARGCWRGTAGRPEAGGRTYRGGGRPGPPAEGAPAAAPGGGDGPSQPGLIRARNALPVP
jgi:hypothetical protein